MASIPANRPCGVWSKEAGKSPLLASAASPRPSPVLLLGPRGPPPQERSEEAPRHSSGEGPPNQLDDEWLALDLAFRPSVPQFPHHSLEHLPGRALRALLT